MNYRFVILCLLLLLALVACDQDPVDEPLPEEIGGEFVDDAADAEPTPEPARPIRSSISADGQLEAQRQASLSLPMAGKVDAVMVAVGDRVSAGDVLVRMDDAALVRAVTSARQNLELQEANIALALVAASPDDIASAEASVASAQANLDSVGNGPTAAEIAQAQANIRVAQSSVTSAVAQRDALDKPVKPASVAVAEANLRAAEASVNAAWRQLETVRAGATQAEITNSEANLVSTQQQYDAAQDYYDAVFTCYEQDDGFIYCPRGDEQQGATQNLDLAEKQLAAAQAALQQLLNGPDEATLQNAIASHNSAISQRDSAKAQLNDLYADPEPSSIASADASITSARANLESARASLDTLMQGNTESQIISAEAQLTQAEAALANLLRGPKDEQLVVYELQLEQARLSLQEAEEALDNALLVAPFDGVVTAVNVRAGEDAIGVAIELIDFDSLELIVNIDEVDIGIVAVGQEATATFKSFPADEVTADVVAIAPTAAQTQNSTSVSSVLYKVHLRVHDNELALRLGMTAKVQLIVER